MQVPTQIHRSSSNASSCRTKRAADGHHSKTNRHILGRPKPLLQFCLAGLLICLGLAQKGSAQIPLLRYSFDEVTGPALDTSGKDLQANGTFSGTGTRTTTTPGGYPEGAFDAGTGGGGFITAGDADKLDALQKFTLTAWIRLYGTPVNGQFLISKRDVGNTTGFVLLYGVPSGGATVMDATNFSIKLRVGTLAASGTSADLNADHAWIFVAATYDGTAATSNLKFYNGGPATAVGSATTKTYNAGTPPANSESFQICAMASAAATVSVMVDDVRVYTNVLSQAQLETVRQSNLPPTLWWDRSGSTAGATNGPDGVANGVWSGSGVWAANNNWSISSAGTFSPQQWSDGSIAIFAAGSDATGSYTVTVSNAPTASAINIEEGAVTFAGSDVNSFVTLTGETIDVASGASASFGPVTIAGTAGLTKTNAGTLTLNAANSYSGDTTVSGGTLALGPSGSINGVVTVASGATLMGRGTINGLVTVASGATLAPGSSVSTITFNNGLILAGNLFIEVDKTLSPSNDLAVVTGTLTNAGTGTLTVTNLGATPLVAGDSFTLFSQPLTNGSALTIVSDGGVVWTNKLEVDGSIQVVSAPSAGQAYLQWGVTGGNSLGFTWTNANVKLQAQTNAAGIQLGDTNWFDYPGGGSSPVNVTIDPANPSVFFRLRSQ